MKKFQCNIVHQKFNMSHNVLMEFLSRGPGLELMKQKMGTNQIKSIRRTKKMGPTINEHRNEKTYLKNWNLGALWKKSELSLVGCWKETNKEGFWQRGMDKRDFDKRVRLTGFWLKVWVSEWVATDERIVSGKVRVSMFKGGECLSVRVSDLGV